MFPCEARVLTAGKTAKEILMKKLLVLVVVAILLGGGLVLMSCGDNCPGGRSSGGAGNCSWGSGGYGWCTKNILDCMPGTTTRCTC